MPTQESLIVASVDADIAPVWRAAAAYMRARKNDIHVPISYAFARRLIAAYPEADALVVSLAIVLHDIGWHAIDEGRILNEAFGPDMMESDVRILHEKEGVRLAKPLLRGLGYEAAVIEEVCKIIDGHDTRPDPISLNDSLVKDADKLWRFTPAGVAVACDWFRKTPTEYMARLEAKVLPALFRCHSRNWALEDLAASRALLQADLI
ncbi:HD domain-containing protein [Tropicibacter alexandrii]|uniref:HD domain-containing protein n=1 Tax=Tropicibacter alexandrii TaxID=2267683 RepID=UPI000EF49EB7|nr:HD domain-containing protein [Tropicibacter alexandrii]